MTLIAPGLLVVAAVINSDRTTSAQAFTLQDFTLLSLLGSMLMSLRFIFFCQVQAERKGDVLRGEIPGFRDKDSSRQKWSYLSLQAAPFSDILSDIDFGAARRNILQYKVLISFNYHKKYIFIKMHRTTSPMTIKSIELSYSVFYIFACHTFSNKYLHFCDVRLFSRVLWIFVHSVAFK